MQQDTNYLLLELNSLLSQGRFYEADIITTLCLLPNNHVIESNRIEITKQVTEDDINSISIDILREVNILWLKYSNNHFGFQVQYRVFNYIKKWAKNRATWDSPTQLVINGLEQMARKFLFEGSSHSKPLRGRGLYYFIRAFELTFGWLDPNNCNAQNTRYHLIQPSYTKNAPYGNLPRHIYLSITTASELFHLNNPEEALKRYGALSGFRDGYAYIHNYELLTNLMSRVKIIEKYSNVSMSGEQMIESNQYQFNSNISMVSLL